MNDANRIVIEACVGNFEDAVAAAELGADRLEFCSALEIGGLTPNHDELRRLRESVSTPIVAMVRPRRGDFNYSSVELRSLLDDASRMLGVGVDGLVFGALTPDRRIDVEATREIIELTRTRPGTDAVFHKAIDQSADVIQAFELLKLLGVDRVLTSGGADTALEGASVLKPLVEHVRPEILVGGGVRAHNVVEILRATGAREIHSSCLDLERAGVRLDRRAFASLVAAVRQFEGAVG